MFQPTLLLSGLLLATVSFGEAPAGAPAGATGICKDGTYWTNAQKRGACHGHKGVQAWYGAAEVQSGAAAAAPAPAAPAAPAAAAPKPASAPAHSSYAPPASAAAGGGAGMVWVNKNTKVYHCPADRWYGKTKNGAYMSEADAKAQGDRPDHGKACQ